MPYSVRLEQFPGTPLAIVRRRAALPELPKIIPEACGTVWKILRTLGIQNAGRLVAVYLDNVCNLEIGVELQSPIAPTGEILPGALPIGDVAVTTHFGPYHLLGAAHDAIHQWCRQNSREPIRPCWETYAHWQDTWNTDPAQIRTDVYYLLKP